MKKVFIVHGFQGRPNGAWRPWLMRELSKNDIYACALAMPTPDVPIKSEWVNKINEVVGIPNEDIFLVGHSLGVPAILRYLESLDKDSKIGGVILISGPISLIKEDGYESVNKFIDRTFDFDHIKNVCKYFIIIYGDADSLISSKEEEELSKKLEGFLISIPNGGHFSSVTEFPEVLDSLLKMMKVNS